MTHPRYILFLKAALVWAAAVIIGSVGGWSVSFFGYGILAASVFYGLLAGKLLARLGAHNPWVIAVLLFTSGIIARLAVAAYLLKQPDIPIPPSGAWQTITDMFIPWPIPAIALLLIGVSAAIRIVYHSKKQTHPHYS